MFGLKRERKDPAEIAEEFTKNMEEQDALQEKEDEKQEDTEKDETEEKEEVDDNQEKEPDNKQDEKSDQEDSESSTEEKPEETEEDDDKKKKKGSAEQRITELISEIKALRNDSKVRDQEYLNRIESLEQEKEAIRREAGLAPEDKIEDEVRSLERQRIEKYLEEDRRLPREERREMSKEEYEDWLAEDIASATDWRVEQRLRRDREKKEDAEKLKIKSEVTKIRNSQRISQTRVEARHPELNVSKEREQLKNQGMLEEEIHKHFLENNEKYRVMAEIMQSDRTLAQKAILDPKGPELLEKEMLKRLDSTSSQDDNDEDELAQVRSELAALKEMMGVEEDRKSRIDVGITSKKGARPVKNKKVDPQSDAIANELAKLNKKGYKMTKEEYDDMMARRDTIRGADQNDRS